ncbi:MAG: acyltransferase family protein, partial [Methanosarcina sp.]|nr:acyltransferase family protein [Methanosarcina sp.]
ALYGIYSIVYALGPLISYNPPLWFLSCLFVTELLFYGFAKKSYGEPRKLVLWLTAAGVIGHLYSIYVPFRLLWNADVALSAVVFYGAGNLFRKFTEPKKESGSGSDLNSGSSLSSSMNLGSRLSSGSSLSLSSSMNLGLRFREGFFRVEKFLPGVFILLNLLYLGYLLKFPTTDMVNMNVLKYGGFFSYYLLAFSGIFAFVYLFKKVGSSKILEYYGRNSLIVLALHFPLKDVLIKLAVLGGVDYELYHYNAVFALSLTVLNLICVIPLIFLINSYFPFLIGKKGSFAKFEGFKSRFKKLVNQWN